MKKFKLVLIVVFMFLISIILNNEIYAVSTMDLNIIDERPYTGSYYTVTTPNGNEHTIFKIIKRYDTATIDVIEKNDAKYVYEDALYCLRAGLGFGNSESVNVLNDIADVTYTESYNLKTDVTEVMNYYINTIEYNISNTEYNSILWIIDNMYLPEHTDAEYLKEKLLNDVFEYDGGNNISMAELEELSDDDIEFVQQMALWYFSNYDENGEQNSLSLPETYVLSNTTKINEESLSESKQKQIDILYEYFIENAKSHSTDYGIGDIREITMVKPEVNVDSSSKTVTEDQNYTVIGPFNITETAGNVDYDLEIIVKDNNGNVISETQEDIPVIYVVENVTDMVQTYTSIEEAVGNGEFYLKISNLWAEEYDLTDVSIYAQCSYDKMYTTTATLWLAGTEDQPVIKIDKEAILEGDFQVILEKVDESGNLLFGAEFTMISEDRQVITITNNGDGTFNSPLISITEDGQEFIYEIEEISAPSGYIGINGAIKIKVTTKINSAGSAYEIDTVEFINATGEVITIDGVSFEVINNTITITVINVREMDLALRKFITAVNEEEVTTRIPEIDTSKLNTIDETTGDIITTATYTHSKEAVIVQQGDIVTFTIRVYNEGGNDSYVTEIADYIPEGLGYLMDYKTNTDNFWVVNIDETTQTLDLVGENGLYDTETAIKNLEVDDFYTAETLSDVKILVGDAKISSTALEDEIIKAYNAELEISGLDGSDDWQQSTNGADGLYYRDIEVTCIVLEENSFQGTLRNIAEIQEYQAVDADGEELVDVEDRDSEANNVDTDNYNPPSDNSSYQEDDDDYESLVLRHFDLALRKFITAVNEEEVTTRIPEVEVDENGEIEYTHDKTPVYVSNSDIVTYTIRVYNEGTVLGYATEISDDIPDGLMFLPENQTNIEYGWKMYDAEGEETTDPEEAVEIKTAYLENSLLNPYDSTVELSQTNPNYAEVKVAFQVVEENITQEDRIIENKAQITEDKAVDEEGNEIDIEDEDSIPDEWNEGEDDQDIEKIYVKIFDLALLKWVSQTIVTVDGVTTVTDTGFTAYDDPEPIAKVVIDKNKLDETTVKFVYNIIIINQGEIEGYATEITDYIPEGLEFVAEDNPIWTQVGDNKITTRALEGTLLQPGESATLEVVFTWKNDSENLGLKLNIAEISEDYNDKGSEDIDSEPDNVETEDYNEQQEDDDDKALVILELKTGGTNSYVWLGLTVLLILAGGILLIQKFVM